VMVAGRHAASGDFREIRRLMTARPHQYAIMSSDNRALAAALVADGSVTGVQLTQWLYAQTSDFARFSVVLAGLARKLGVRLFEVVPADESLESVFAYLVDADRGGNVAPPATGLPGPDRMSGASR
jgi:ABC-2 type transport system ATP-binding protein